MPEVNGLPLQRAWGLLPSIYEATTCFSDDFWDTQRWVWIVWAFEPHGDVGRVAEAQHHWQSHTPTVGPKQPKLHLDENLDALRRNFFCGFDGRRGGLAAAEELVARAIDWLQRLCNLVCGCRMCRNPCGRWNPSSFDRDRLWRAD